MLKIRILLSFATGMTTVAATAQDLPPRPAPIQHAQTETARIAYYAVGPKDAPAVLFVHGLPFSSYIWRDVISALDDGSRRLIAVDLVGFGDSTGTGFGVAEQAAHLDRFVAALDLKDLTVVGHDWGAGIGLILAHENAQLMRGFAFAEGAMPPVYPRPTYDEMPERVAGMFQSMREEDAEANVLDDNLWQETILPTMSLEPLPAVVLAEYKRAFPTPESRQPLLDMSRSLPIGGEPADVVVAYSAAAAWWRGTDLPKLVMFAEPGRLYPAAMVEWTEANIPNVTTTSVGPGLHVVQEENPTAVASAIDAWLDTIEGETE
ncbi:haloalkane dehalogenase [Litoreibacter roseus]|uniref:Haloalkane dehalogenase n=1 Tax=Litoreibacter roseus TaxID=2601869 RepID=A0A6N6JAT5_9RHOB|nr:haloalkane dehalogenase [Litoreibacter roseus]GFE63154.1 haloalkane dehalogenase [Litoreibacter roseus]